MQPSILVRPPASSVLVQMRLQMLCLMFRVTWYNICITHLPACVEKTAVDQTLLFCLPGQYAYAGYMPNKPTFVDRLIPARGSDGEKVSLVEVKCLPHCLCAYGTC